MLMKGAEALVKSLEKENVEVIFGIPGGATIPFYDVLYDSGIRHILVRHEQVAAHAADGYARVSGKVGVCCATSGPGATNLTTGITNAYMDSIPIVALTGQVPTIMIGKDAFQEADTIGITMPITKHNFQLRSVEEIPKIVKKAFFIAKTGRPGPVLIDIPKDVQEKEGDITFPDEIVIPGYKPTIKGNINQIKRAVKLILNSERPIILAGGGVILSNACEELIKLAEMLLIPVVTTLMGKGCFPETHPLSLGCIGMHGRKAANYAINDADLIIAIGCRFSDRSTGAVSLFAPEAKIIHIDIDPAEIGKNVKADLPIVGDAKHVLKDMLTLLEKSKKKERATGKKTSVKKVSLTNDKQKKRVESTAKETATSDKKIQIVTSRGAKLVPVVTIDKIVVLDKVVENIEVICHDLPQSAAVDGILGLNFIRNFKLFINFDRGILELE